MQNCHILRNSTTRRILLQNTGNQDNDKKWWCYPSFLHIFADQLIITMGVTLNQFSENQIIDRIKFENPWWETNFIDKDFDEMKRRLYFNLFYPLFKSEVRRAIVLMGPRRVGKTVMLFHAIQELIKSGISPKKICYLSIETPIYNNVGLENLFTLCRKATGISDLNGYYIFYDEIQYLKEWEVHLKNLVDSYRQTKFIASGSAAAALKLKSNESGAGRFTEFMLPPLTFCEFIYLKELDHLMIAGTKKWGNSEIPFYKTNDIGELNRQFIDYINYGGYPEVVFSSEIRKNPGRYIRSDIIDKVLLRDLPSLYGIKDVQELNSLFTTIAFNSGNEVSLEALSSTSGVSKDTVKTYITYLESAFLIKIIHRVDNSAKKFRRPTQFKVYLTNPSLRCALFSPVSKDDEFIGNMVETAVFSQWFHRDDELHYARWKSGEVDIVSLDKSQRPKFAIEIKWSNRCYENPLELLKGVTIFSKKHRIYHPIITTIDKEGVREIDDINYDFVPASCYCYTVSKNALDTKINRGI